MPNDRFSQFFDRWLNRINRTGASRRSQSRGRARLGLEVFEDRVVPASLPAPLVESSRTIVIPADPLYPTGTLVGSAPSIAVDPTNPNRMALANSDGITVTVALTVNGGADWTVVFTSTRKTDTDGNQVSPERLFDPTISPNNLDYNRAYTNASNATVAFSRDGFIYLSYLQTNAAKSVGVVVVNKLEADGTLVDLDTSSLYPNFSGKILYQWDGQDPAFNPVVSVDTNLPNYTDPGLDNILGTLDDQTFVDTMAGKAVYVAWNTNATARAIAPGGNLVFNPNIINVVASADGGENFSNPLPVSDQGYIVNGGNLNFGATAPRITFSPNNSSNPGQLVFSWSNTRNGRLFVDASSPDNGNATAPAVGAQSFLFGGGGFGDAITAAAQIPNIVSASAIPTPGFPGSFSLLVIFDSPVVKTTFTLGDISSIIDPFGALVTGYSAPTPVDGSNNPLPAATTTTTRFLIDRPAPGFNQPGPYSVNLTGPGAVTGVPGTGPDTEVSSYFSQVLQQSDFNPDTLLTDLNVKVAISNSNLNQLQTELLYFATPIILGVQRVATPGSPGQFSLVVQFNKNVDRSTFSAADILQILDPSSNAAAGPFTVVASDNAGTTLPGSTPSSYFRIDQSGGFTAAGTYSVTVGDDIAADAATNTPDRVIVLFRNRIVQDGNTRPASATTGTPGVASPATANKGFLGIEDFNAAGQNVVGTVFDDEAPRVINDANNLAPYIGSYQSESSTGLTTYGSGSDQFSDFDGLTSLGLAGTWSLKITDFRNDRAPGSPPQGLNFWELDFTSHISDEGFGDDDNVNSPSGGTPVQSLVTGVDTVHPTKLVATPTAGVGSGQSIAFDTSAGAFSPYAGRLYMVYTIGTAPNTNIVLIASDNNGASWFYPRGTVAGAPVTINDDTLSDNFTEGVRSQFQPNVTVDPLTGTLVITWFDARNDAANGRVATYMTTSIDGGATFSPQVSLNKTKTAKDTITGKTVNIEPIPSNFTNVGTTGFGNAQAVVAYGGRVSAFWAGNNNADSLAIQTGVGRFGAGPRIIDADSGPVTADAQTPIGGVRYNDTFAPDGTRKLDGFTVVFDRPVDYTSFDPSDIKVYYLSPNNTSNLPVDVAGTLVGVASVTPMDLDAVNGLATTFFVRFTSPQTAVGTYSYTVGPNIRDRIRNPNPSPLPSVASTDTPTPINTADSISSTINYPGLPAGQTVDNVTVTLNFTHQLSPALRIELVSPSGTRVLLFNGYDDVNFFPPRTLGGSDTQFQNLTFLDGAPSLDNLLGVFDLSTGITRYTGTFSPDSLLYSGVGLADAFTGEEAVGKWTLVFSDLDSGDTLTAGNLIQWSIGITGENGIPQTDLELGNVMDQDHDAVYGETSNDVFSAPGSTNGQPLQLPFSDSSLPLIIPGPHVVTTSTPGPVAAPVVTQFNSTTVLVTFNQAILTSSLQNSDILAIAGAVGAPLTGPFTVTPVQTSFLSTSTQTRYFLITNGSAVPVGPYSISFRQQPQVADVAFVSSGASSIDVTFDRDINAATFTAADVLRVNTPIGILTSGFTVTQITSRTYRVSFAAQVVSGPYSIEIGPDIQSVSGFSIDSNLNAGLDRLRGGNPLSAPLLFNDYPSSGGSTVIPPNATVSMPLDIVDSFLIQQNNFNQIQVRLNITYAQQSNLIAELVSPTGTRIRLFTNVGPTSSTIPNFNNTLLTDFGTTPIQNGVAPFDNGPYSPQLPLSALIGETSQGTWRLEITNTGSGSGSINNFTLRLPFADSGTGLGELQSDKISTGFRIYNLDPTNPITQDTWTPVGSTPVNANQVGRVSAVAIDPSDPSGNTVYAGGNSGGVWKTTNFLTTSLSGPTWVPLTDFGSISSLAIGSITVFPRNNDPLQSIIYAVTGNSSGSSPNFSSGNAPGVGFLRSTDGGRTWKVLDSSNNVDASGNVLPIGSASRDHIFVGATGFKIITDPNLDAFGNVIVYAALSGSPTQNGIWRSNDGGNKWTRILAGNATDVVLAAGSQGVSGNLQIMYAAIANTGVYITPTAPTASLGSFRLLDGGTGNPLIKIGGPLGAVLGVNNPGVSPSGASGIIKLGVPNITNSPLQNDFYQAWIYVMTTRGLYMSKDFGANWTLARIPTTALRQGSFPVEGGFGTNNESRLDEDPVNYWNFFGFDLVVDPTNANIVYIGGGEMIKVDVTTINDPQAYVTRDNSAAGTPAFSANTTGGVNGGGTVLQYNPATLSYTPANSDFLNLKRDPSNPFLSPSTIPVTGGTAFTNDGANTRWQPLDNFMAGTRGLLDFVAIVDPITKKTRLVYGTEGGIYSSLDDTSGTTGAGIGSATTSVGFLNQPGLIRNGTLQLAQLVSGAVQTSQLAADLAGAMFYSMSIADLGAPVSSANAVQSGDVSYRNGTFPGTWVAVDPSGSGASYQFQAAGQFNLSPPVTFSDFFRYIAPGTDPSLGGISRTNGLFTPGGPTGGTLQWPYFDAIPDFFSGPIQLGQSIINTRDPNAMMIGSSTGRIYRSVDKGLNWFEVASPANMGNSYAQALAFGAPNSNAAIGPVVATNNFLYAGTLGGQIRVTLTGGAPWKTTSGLDGSAVQRIIANPISGKFDAYAVTSNGVYYLPDARLANPVWQNITGNLFSLQTTMYGDNTELTQAIREITTIAVDWRGIGAIPNDSNTGIPATLYIGGDGGVFRSTNGGTSWTVFPAIASDGAPADGGYLPRVRVTDLDLSLGDIDPTTGQPKKNGGGLNMLVATTFGRGQFAIRLSNTLPTGAFVSGPTVTSVADNGLVGGLPSLKVTFSGPIFEGSFQPGDVSLVNGGTSIAVMGVTAIANPDPSNGADLRNQFIITFATPVTAGTYTLKIGQNITDLAGNPMNQNANTVNGEASDAYSQSVVVSTSAPFFSVTARLGGVVFLDVSGDGIQNSGEAGISGRTVYADLNNNSVRDAGEPVSTTDANGRYDLGYLSAGSYRIRETLFSSQTLTGVASPGFLNVALAAGVNNLSVNLGNRDNSSVFPVQVTANLFTTSYANANIAWVNNLFRVIFNADPSPAQVTSYVNALNAGSSRYDLAYSIFTWVGVRPIQVGAVFQAVLGRQPSPEGMTIWATALSNGSLRDQDLIKSLIGMAEYQVKYPTNDGYIRSLYRDIFGREASQGEVNIWLGYLASGAVTRTSLASMLVDSAESSTRILNSLFVQVLHRLPAPFETAAFSPALSGGTFTYSQMISLLLSTDEFYFKSAAAAG